MRLPDLLLQQIIDGHHLSAILPRTKAISTINTAVVMTMGKGTGNISSNHHLPNSEAPMISLTVTIMTMGVRVTRAKLPNAECILVKRVYLTSI